MIPYILIFLAAIVLALIIEGAFFSQSVLYIQTRSREHIIGYESETPVFDLEWFKKLDKEHIDIRSTFGYRLHGLFIPNENSKKTMIFCHGVRTSHLGSVKYAKLFFRRGWNLFLYDHPRHGDSEGKVTGFGYYEKIDLKTVVHVVKEKMGEPCFIGIHGESMGAATVLQYAGLEDGGDFYIADCPYSGLWEQLAWRLKKDYHLPAFPLMHITDFFIKCRGKFRIQDVNPLEAVRNINKPVLFIHGDADTYVPTEMSRRLFAAKTGYREIYIAEGAAHARSLRVNPEEYEKRVFQFIDKVEKKST